MTAAAIRKRRKSSALALAALAVLSAGCAHKQLKPAIVAPYTQTTIIALAPVLNFSGTRQLDTLKVTDILYSELQQIPGLAIVPVNRVLAQMAQDHVDAIQTPQQALTLAERLDADAIIVAAITEYNPYYPPVVGMVMQIYGFEGQQPARQAFDPVELERQASPTRITVDLNQQQMPKSQVQRIYNAGDSATAKLVKRFAKLRGTGNDPYRWQLYMRSQSHYLRFVCHESIRELLEQECCRMNESFLSDRQEYN